MKKVLGLIILSVVALSAMPVDEAGPWFRDAGFAAYIEKPIDVIELPGQIRRQLRSG